MHGSPTDPQAPIPWQQAEHRLRSQSKRVNHSQLHVPWAISRSLHAREFRENWKGNHNMARCLSTSQNGIVSESASRKSAVSLGVVGAPHFSVHASLTFAAVLLAASSFIFAVHLEKASWRDDGVRDPRSMWGICVRNIIGQVARLWLPLYPRVHEREPATFAASIMLAVAIEDGLWMPLLGHFLWQACNSSSLLLWRAQRP
mmetsp:Transcript_141024/g.358367  ORF Transcript_141024/g.358367 Transcript_141024/m.358367 type:complete len:202 (+) Transcript_141024:41-646(+)